MKKALICGSYAFDSIMTFHDRFKNHILPDKVHILNVSFLVPNMRKEFGGCAGNITYNLNLLGANAIPMATVGEDFVSYKNWLDKCGIDYSYIKVIENTYTGQAFITTDLDDNQITAFHPGAMNESHKNKISVVNDIAIGIVSPDGKDGMLEHARDFYNMNVPFIFDPGQGMPMFSSDELKNFIKQASWIALNDYESQMLADKTGLSITEIANEVKALIITKGKEGSEIYVNNEIIKIIPTKACETLDPTGCGDAYRAGLIFGIMNNLDWKSTGQLASVLGAIKVAHLGTQNHSFDIETIIKTYKQQYGEDLKV